MMTTPLEAYRARVATEDIAFDEAQALAAEALTLLHQRLKGYDPKAKAGLLSGLFAKRSKLPPIKGLYMFGGVGRGKSMLMDLFFDEAPVVAKRRVHFHAFMLEIHELMGRWRKLDEAARKREAHYVKGAGDDPIPPVAKKVAQEATLLCFDEFQVEDVADAMILGRLFKELFASGVILVATSNRAPDDLYKDGLNRQLFLPSIALLKVELDILELDSGTDYRLQRLAGSLVYHVAEGDEARAALDAAWQELTDKSRGEPCSLEVKGRKILVPKSAKGVARFSFDMLCREARGAADYLAIASAFHVVMIDDIPQLTGAERNEAKRFVTLIDALYEHKVKLVCSAAAPPQELYEAGDGSFQFERTASRLIEMQSTDYMASRHIID